MEKLNYDGNSDSSGKRKMEVDNDLMLTRKKGGKKFFRGENSKR